MAKRSFSVSLDKKEYPVSLDDRYDLSLSAASDVSKEASNSSRSSNRIPLNLSLRGFHVPNARRPRPYFCGSRLGKSSTTPDCGRALIAQTIASRKVAHQETVRNSFAIIQSLNPTPLVSSTVKRGSLTTCRNARIARSLAFPNSPSWWASKSSPPQRLCPLGLLGNGT